MHAPASVANARFAPLPAPEAMTFIGRYDLQFRINAPGWTVSRVLAQEAGPVISLGPNYGINEAILAARFPERRFTLIDEEAECLQTIKNGHWSFNQAGHAGDTARSVNAIIGRNGGADILAARHSGIYRLAAADNMEFVHARYPCALGEPAQVCLAFNVLPAGIEAGDRVYRWLFHEAIRPGGVLVNEWGAFRINPARDKVVTITSPTGECHASRMINDFLPTF